ncbi:MAG: DUF6067 family protein [Limnochordia bacterium]|jgi:3',5'-cyclic AMP phosphodiesterase CpdA|nr:DUF6067 family protein [Limnochordia bacterium]
MKRGLISVMMLACLLASTSAFCMDEGSYCVWVANNCQKILRDQLPPQERNMAINLEAAKNEYEGAQVIIRAMDSKLSNVSVSISDLVDEGAVISSEHISVYKQHYMQITTPTTDFPPGWYPDALIPITADSYFDVEAGVNQGVWLTVKIPKGIPAGSYEGTLNISGDSIEESLPIRLSVWDFELPDENHSKTSSATWWDQLLVGHPGIYRGSQEFYELLRNYYNFFLDYRISSMDLPIDDRYMDGYVSTAEQYINDPRVTSYRIPYYTDLMRTHRLVKKLKDNDLLEKGFFYVIDEPTPSMFDSINQTGKKIKSIDPELKHLVTMDINEAVMDSVNTWCTILTSWMGEYPQVARELQQKNDNSIWWYTCVNPKRPFPSYHIDDYLIGARILSWMQKAHNVEGNLYWAVNIYQKYDLDKGYISRDIWNDPLAFPGANGDGYLVYPGTEYGINGPIGSIRLEAIRDGNEDYEYLWLLERRMEAVAKELGIDFDTEEAMQPYFNRLFSSVKSYNEDPAELLEIRREVAHEIVRLDKSPKYLVEVDQLAADGPVLTVYVEPGATLLIDDEVCATDGDKAVIKLPSSEDVYDVNIKVVKDNKINTVTKRIAPRRGRVETYRQRISYLETREELGKWKFQNVESAISDRFSSQGIYSMQVTFAPNVDWPNIKLSHDNGGLSITDWSSYETFDFDVYNEEEGITAQIYVKFFEKNGKAFDRNWFNVFSKRQSHISIPINEIELDVSNMGCVEIWMHKTNQPITLHFDNFTLTKALDATVAQVPIWGNEKALSSSNISSKGVRLAWTGIDDQSIVQTYEIYMNGRLLDAVDANVSEYDVAGLEHDTEYVFHIEARSGTGHLSSNGPATIVRTENDEVVLNLAVLSDIHIHLNNTSIPHDTVVRFERALKDLKTTRPDYDALIVVGDLTSHGLDEEYDDMVEVIRNHKVSPVFYTLGNHEYWRARMDDTYNINDAKFPNGETEEMTHQRFLDKTNMPGIYYDEWITGKNGEDYHLVFLSPEKFWQTDQSIGDKAYISDEQIDWLQERLAEGADAHKPIFVFIHQPLESTLSDSDSYNSVIQTGKINEILEQFPQVILFSGHTHYDLNRPGNMYQETFTTFNTSSVYYTMESDKYPERSQGLYVDVYHDKVVVLDREFSDGSWVNGGAYRVLYPREASPKKKAAIRVSKQKVSLNDTIDVTLSNLPSPVGARDWIGLYEVDQVPGGGIGSIWWRYLPDLGITNDSGSFSLEVSRGMVSAGKTYKLVLFYNDSYEVEALGTFEVYDSEE